MELILKPLLLKLRRPFRIAHGNFNTRENLLVTLKEKNHSGYGEVAVVSYYGDTLEHVIESLQSTTILDYFRTQNEVLLETINQFPRPSSKAVCAGLQMALYDLLGKQENQSLSTLLGIQRSSLPPSAVTVALSDDEARFRSELQEKSNYPIIKIKLGSGDIEWDLHLAKIAREEIQGQLCFDANGGWNLNEMFGALPKIKMLHPIYLEQTFAAHDTEAWIDFAAKRSPGIPPIIADESVCSEIDLVTLAPFIDGVNIKISKCGGISEAIHLIHRSRELGLKVMLGCMIESSLGIGAAAHLAPLADFLDLDGSLLLEQD